MATLLGSKLTEVESSIIGVNSSVTGKKWVLRDIDERMALMLSQRFSLPEIVGRILANRGINAETASQFLNPTLRDSLPDPNCLVDMEKAVERLFTAIVKSESIAVFGDYDVDGATSSALICRFFSQIGINVRVYIPDRISEGYGPNWPALKKLKEDNINLVITVDCGITAFDVLEKADKSNLDVIVLDHHVAEPELPKALAIVNPNRLDDDSELGILAAVGVSFLMLVALNRHLRNAKWYHDNSLVEPNLLGLLDLVALGTVCDVVKLSGLNRAFVKQGLSILSQRKNTGLRELADISKIDQRPSAYHAGFVLGPRINAGGRVGESWLGARLLTTEDQNEAKGIALRLDNYNCERQQIEQTVLDEALTLAEEETDKPIIIISSDRWHAGVIGIVASRIKDKYARPCILIGFDDLTGKGSGRSIDGIDLGSVVISARQNGIIESGGGHKMAAGLTLQKANLPSLKKFLIEKVGQLMEQVNPKPSLYVDSIITLNGVNQDLTTAIQMVAPFGSGNPEPRFIFESIRIIKADIVGDRHIRCILTDSSKKNFKAIAFRAVGEPIGDALLNTHGLPVHITGKIRENIWRGKNEMQIIIEDVAKLN